MNELYQNDYCVATCNESLLSLFRYIHRPFPYIFYVDPSFSVYHQHFYSSFSLPFFQFHISLHICSNANNLICFVRFSYIWECVTLKSYFFFSLPSEWRKKNPLFKHNTYIWYKMTRSGFLFYFLWPFRKHVQSSYAHIEHEKKKSNPSQLNLTSHH